MMGLTLAPFALIFTTTVRTFAYRHDHRKRVLTYAAALLACSMLLRLPVIRDDLGELLYRACGMTNLPLLASVILGAAAADKLGYYGQRLTRTINEQRSTRLALLSVAITLLVLAYAERRVFGLATGPGDRSLLMQFALTVLGVQLSYCVVHLILGARAVMRQCPSRRHGTIAAAWITAGVFGTLYALVLVLWPILDNDNDGALNGIDYFDVVWILHWPMCLALSVGCSTLPIRRLLAMR